MPLYQYISDLPGATPHNDFDRHCVSGGLSAAALTDVILYDRGVFFNATNMAELQASEERFNQHNQRTEKRSEIDTPHDAADLTRCIIALENLKATLPEDKFIAGCQRLCEASLIWKGIIERYSWLKDLVLRNAPYEEVTAVLTYAKSEAMLTSIPQEYFAYALDLINPILNRYKEGITEDFWRTLEDKPQAARSLHDSMISLSLPVFAQRQSGFKRLKLSNKSSENFVYSGFDIDLANAILVKINELGHKASIEYNDSEGGSHDWISTPKAFARLLDPQLTDRTRKVAVYIHFNKEQLAREMYDKRQKYQLKNAPALEESTGISRDFRRKFKKPALRIHHPVLLRYKNSTSKNDHALFSNQEFIPMIFKSHEGNAGQSQNEEYRVIRPSYNPNMDNLQRLLATCLGSTLFLKREQVLPFTVITHILLGYLISPESEQVLVDADTRWEDITARYQIPDASEASIEEAISLAKDYLEVCDREFKPSANQEKALENIMIRYQLPNLNVDSLKKAVKLAEECIEVCENRYVPKLTKKDDDTLDRSLRQQLPNLSDNFFSLAKARAERSAIASGTKVDPELELRKEMAARVQQKREEIQKRFELPDWSDESISLAKRRANICIKACADVFYLMKLEEIQARYDIHQQLTPGQVDASVRSMIEEDIVYLEMKQLFSLKLPGHRFA